MSFLDQANDAIRAAGGRVTPQRQIIIETLATAGERIDAETLHHAVQQGDTSVDLTTVYRTLEMLEAAKLIRSQYISPDHDRKYYTLAAGLYHFTCRRCHRVIPFTSSLVDELKQRLELDFQVQALNACICVDGLCPDCQALEQKEMANAERLNP